MPRKVPPLLGAILTALRTAKGWTQKELARATGRTHHEISELETGDRTLTRELLEELAAPMGIEPEEIDLALFRLDGLGAGEAGAEPDATPVAPTAAERRGIRRAALAAARAAARAVTTELVRRTAARRASRQRREARETAERLLRYPPADQRYLVESIAEYRSWAVCERICAASERAAAADAGRALALADLALFIARHTPGGDGWRARVQGFAWAFVGNARRVAGKLREADRAFAELQRLWRAGAAADPGVLAEGHVLDLEASLRRDQRRFPEALALHERALAATPPARRGAILLNKSKVQVEVQDYAGALATLEQAASLIDERSDPRSLLVLRFNVVSNLCHLGRYAETERLLPKVRELAARLGNELDLVRLLWLEGRACAGLGRDEEALAALEQVRREFAAREIDYDMALVSLELAVLCVERGETGRVKLLAGEMEPVFRREGVHREALAALRVFCAAAAQERATAELARRVRDYLERARHDPELRFSA